MEPIMQRVAHRVVHRRIHCRIHCLVALASLGAVAGCRLGPLVDDQPGASASVLPKGTPVPSVAMNPDLATQIAINDGLDSNALMMSGNVITRGTGFAADGTQVKYWAIGATSLAPSPMYIFGSGDPMSTSFAPLPNNHPPLVGVVPGDLEYQPIHTIYRVAVTDKYDGQQITTLAALSDAIDLQLVQAPVSIKVFVNWPIVRSGLKLDVGAGGPLAPTPVYAHGYAVDSFRFGGALGLQPNPFGILPTSQVSFLREAGKPAFDPTRPIFQANIPSAPAPNYTPISAVVDVDLVSGKPATDIHKDSELFTRDLTTGNITGTTSNVERFTITSQLLDLQIQFTEGSP
jgi:hypothetical protein